MLPLLPNPTPLLNHLPAFRRDPLRFLCEAGQSAPAVRVRLAHHEYWLLTDADWFQFVLQKRARNFPRDKRLLLNERMAKQDMGTVFNAPTWDEWLWRRRLLQPAFHHKQLEVFAESMTAETMRLTDQWQTGTTLDLVAEMKALTMRIICNTMFSSDLLDTAALQHAFEVTTDFSYRQTTSVLPLPVWVPTPFHLRVYRALKLKYGVIGKIVDERFAATEPKGDLLDTLIAAHIEEDGREGGRQFSAGDLASEMSSIIFAGHETTAMTLVWLLVVVAHNRAIAEPLLAEIETVLGGRPPTLADFPNMPYTERVIQETLRYYPSVYATLRQASEPDCYDGVEIAADTRVILNIRGLHHSDRYWERPEQFDPDRFLPEKSAERHKFAYQPFISGPRKCIGDEFAMMEMRLVVPTLLQQVSLGKLAAEMPKPTGGFVMNTAEPIAMKVLSKR